LPPSSPPLRTAARIALSAVAVALVLACDAGEEGPALELPPRPADAPVGDAIIPQLHDLTVEEREARVRDEVARGNVPTWLRRLQPVETTIEVDGREHRLTFWAAPDYLAIGSDDDYFYVPLSPGAARDIARHAGAALPTPGMVDAIWRAARHRLVPIRIQPDETMWSVRVFRRHDSLVQAQRRQYRARPGAFTAGHKLDVVAVVGADGGAGPGPGEESRPGSGSDDGPGDGRLGLYGWHLSNGTPLQPLHPVDPALPPHFSMGVRLVHRLALLDNRETDLACLLRTPPDPTCPPPAGARPVPQP
jgi:hypothetical protein